MNDEAWRMVWDKLAPMLSTAGLEALRTALAEDDERLLQGATTQPPPLHCVRDWDCEGACVIGYCGWQGDGLKTVGDVEEYFAQTCYAVDQACGEPAAIRYFLNWADETPRADVRRALTPLVVAELDRRKAVAL